MASLNPASGSSAERSTATRSVPDSIPSSTGNGFGARGVVAAPIEFGDDAVDEDRVRRHDRHGSGRFRIQDDPVALSERVAPGRFDPVSEQSSQEMALGDDRLDGLTLVGRERAPFAFEQQFALREELAENDRIELDSRTCDIFDLYGALGAIAGAIADYPDDEVYVNLSAGSKITAIAGMIACMTAGATPIYARPDYGPEGRAIPDEPLHDAVAETFALPTYPIDRPSETEVAYLAFLADADGEGEGRYRGASKKELIGFGEQEGFEFIARSNASTEKGLYRVLDTHVIDPLSERGYIRIEAVGRRKYVSLTEDGENALRAFAHLQ